MIPKGNIRPTLRNRRDLRGQALMHRGLLTSIADINVSEQPRSPATRQGPGVLGGGASGHPRIELLKRCSFGASTVLGMEPWRVEASIDLLFDRAAEVDALADAATIEVRR